MSKYKDFDLNEQWQLYCRLVQLPEDKMGPIQRMETKKAFMGACGQMIVLLKEIGEKDEEEGCRILIDLEEQVSTFWKADLERQFPRN